MPGLGGVRKSTNSRMQLLEIRKMPTTFQATGWESRAGDAKKIHFFRVLAGFLVMPMFTLM
jgi:hypothetical protein